MKCTHVDFCPHLTDGSQVWVVQWKENTFPMFVPSFKLRTFAVLGVHYDDYTAETNIKKFSWTWYCITPEIRWTCHLIMRTEL